MPNFENLDQYEATDPKSGDKEIVPIAPHSLQASEYRPRKRSAAPVKAKARKSEFPEVDVEPISIRQMEKEYRQSGRRISKAGNKFRFRSWRRKIVNFFKSLFGGKKKKKRTRFDKNRNQRPRNRYQNKQGNRSRAPRDGESQKQGQSRNNRRRRRPSRDQSSEGNASGSPQKRKSGPRPEGKQRSEPRKPQEAKGDGANRSRNRRNRRRPSKPGSSNKPQSDNRE